MMTTSHSKTGVQTLETLKP